MVLTVGQTTEMLTTIRGIPLLEGYVLDVPYTFDDKCRSFGNDLTNAPSISRTTDYAINHLVMNCPIDYFMQ